jgi:hypothetical protein
MRNSNLITHILKRKPVISFVTLVYMYQTTRRHVPEECMWRPQTSLFISWRWRQHVLPKHLAITRHIPDDSKQSTPWISLPISWRWWQGITPKRLYQCTKPHGVMSQETTILILAGLRTTNLLKVKLSLRLSTTPWRRMGDGGTDSRVLDLCNGWRCVVSFTPRPLYSRRKRLQYSLDRRLCGPQDGSGHHKSLTSSKLTATSVCVG